MHLLVNATQAIDEGGTVIVESGVEGDEAVVRVSDNGCGIAPEHLSKIFDPFYTTHDVGAGTGLGLSIAHGIVHKLGGRIEVKSKPGEGAVFTVRLPLNGVQHEAQDCTLCR
jgi:signal transduction histidine kinase